MFRTPPGSKYSDKSDEDITDKKKHEQEIPPPKAQLSSVTRKRNEIELLLKDTELDIPVIHEEFTEYLQRVERLYDACERSHEPWLSNHTPTIESFRLRVEAIIHPATKPKSTQPPDETSPSYEPLYAFQSYPRKAPSITSSKSRSSTASSIKYKLAEQRAKLKTREEFSEKEYKLRMEELRIKALRDEELLLLQISKEKLETEKMKKELSTMEEELSESVSLIGLNENEPALAEPPLSVRQPADSAPNPTHDISTNPLSNLLLKQNEISSALVSCQRNSFLPKREITKFDGSDLTKYKSFIINFERNVVANCSDEKDRIIFLQQCTEGKAKRLVESCIHLDSNVAYTKARDLLHNEYGNEFKIAQAYIAKLYNWPSVKSDDAAAIDDLGLFLLECQNYLENMSVYNQLQNPSEIMRIINKLPYKLKDRWRRKTNDLLMNYGQVYFSHLVNFVRNEASVLKQPIFGILEKPEEKKTHSGKKSLLTKSSDEKFCIYCKKVNHELPTCRFFSNLPYDEKSSFIKTSKLCFGCLISNHISKNCRRRMICEKCNMKHPTILHNDDFLKRKTQTEQEFSTLNCSAKGHSTKKISCPIVPAKLKIKNRSQTIVINCALDSGSTDCWINENLLQQLNLRPPETNIKVSSINGRNQRMATKVVNNIQVYDLNDNLCSTIPVTYTKPKDCWPYTKEDLIKENEVCGFGHFKDIPFRFINKEIGMLIGLNEPDLLKPTEIVDGPPGAPFASLHKLGWAVQGPVNRENNSIKTNRIKLDMETLQSTIESYFSKDYVDDTTEKDLSTDDKIWLEDVQSSRIVLPSNHIQVDLPLNDCIELPKNRPQIYRMYVNTRANLEKRNLLKEYDKFIQAMIDENFAEEVPVDDLANPGIWYISHHAVFHKRKKSLRVVFNCSLKYDGISLNDCLRKGPDLTNNLLDILMRFRKDKFAVIGDIRKMFYMVKVPTHNANLMRFFWTNSDGKVSEYRLLVHVFGSVSSPSIANFALKSVVEDSDCSQTAASMIKNDFYVDDLLTSFPTTEDAISATIEVKNTLAIRKFELTSFSSNSQAVVQTLLEKPAAKNQETQILLEETSALGITWNTKKDTLIFSAKFSDCDNKIVTKRYVLKTLASIYDPIGIISPALIPAKKLFQRACREKLDWDDEISPAHLITWKNWKKQMLQLQEYEVPRFTALTKIIKFTELHVFSDGSETAYGAAAYVKLVYDDDSSTVSLIASKSRLTPLNNSTLRTVPRIELCAAKLAVELSQLITRSQAYNFHNKYYWSDSKTVLSYIKNNSLNFHRFVQNKINFIKNFSKASDWNYVKSTWNPADIISRGATPIELKNSKLWNHGPEVISTRSETIPSEDYDHEPEADDIEIRTTTLNAKLLQPDSIDIIMESASGWFKLKLRIASLLMLKHSLLTNIPLEKRITLPDLQTAETQIIKYLQKRYYNEEITNLLSNKRINNHSSLRKLNPFLDPEGIMRVTGRIQNSILTFNMKCPIILPSCPITKLLVEHVHRCVGHMGRETILATLRRKYWLVKGNTMARKVTSQCVTCRKVQGKTSEAIMASLPYQRITGDSPVFTNTAVDYFGPFTVTLGRRKEKRYGVLFSCMASRAIHIEVSFSLSTDSFIQSLRRFYCRRAGLTSLFSDNGTNFTGANKELKSAIKEWNSSQIDTWCKQHEINWMFRVPYSSHHGGHYERHIKTIRKILNSILTEQNLRLDDESLLTIMCEVEAVINNRPLTEMSSDIRDSEALTPNHLLLLNAQVTFPPGLFSKSDLYLKRRWRQSQYLVDLFWKRWNKEYIILLQQRNKWFTKTSNHQIGDLVLVKDVNLPRNQWPLGRIVKTKICDDGVVRSATINISRSKNANVRNFDTTEIDRPIVKLILLRSSDDL